VVTAKIVEARGELVGALMVHAGDEVFAITSAGGVIRTSAAEVKQSGRQTMGVRLMNLASGDSVVGLALNAESLDEEALEDGDEPADQDISADTAGPADEADPVTAELEDAGDGAGEDDEAEE
jgi:DNA gyrase subunit A